MARVYAREVELDERYIAWKKTFPTQHKSIKCKPWEDLRFGLTNHQSTPLRGNNVSGFAPACGAASP
jgi:hypothetical protein